MPGNGWLGFTRKPSVRSSWGNWHTYLVNIWMHLTASIKAKKLKQLYPTEIVVTDKYTFGTKRMQSSTEHARTVCVRVLE